MTSSSERGPALSRGRRALLFVGVGVLGFVLLEGLSSTVIFLRATLSSPAPATNERVHTHYDADLGWSSVPSKSEPDFYGPGKYHRTDSHGFRTDTEVAVEASVGKVRLICSGDSFTFGQGVANDRTFCHLLAEKDDRLESVNMGQRGYGIDQAYLWYVRDGHDLEHAVHVFAFIGPNFDRMRDGVYYGYGKPILRLRDGELVVDNVPAPRFGSWRASLARVGRAAGELRSVRLGRSVFHRSSGAGAAAGDPLPALARAVFDELRRLNRETDSALVLVWLPKKDEIDREETRWRPWLHRLADEAGFIFIDLSQDLRALPRDEAVALFIGEEDGDYIDAAGHYNERGHAWVADVLHTRLRGVPAVAARLAPSGGEE